MTWFKHLFLVLDAIIQTCLLLSFLLLNVHCRGIPLISSFKVKRGLASRAKVKELQLQSMLKSLEKEDDDMYSFFYPRSDTVKRDVEGSPVDNRDLTKLFGEHIPWDIVRRQVPFDALIKRNKKESEDSKMQNEAFLDKKDSTPCRRKRSTTDDKVTNKRNLKTPPGEGIIPAYNIYDDICEDSQPVEVVKIKKLIVEDGIIKDQNIIEKSMLG